MRNYEIDIFRLSNKLHQFKFDIDEVFFNSLEQELVNQGNLVASIDMDKTDSLICMDFKIEGTVELICDRSLDPFQHRIENSHRMIFKYGDREQEIAEDVIMITTGTQKIDVGQYIFEFIGLAIPMKKLHPRYQQEGDEFGSMIYTSDFKSNEGPPQTMDPRWNDLKKLKKN